MKKRGSTKINGIEFALGKCDCVASDSKEFNF